MNARPLFELLFSSWEVLFVPLEELELELAFELELELELDSESSNTHFKEQI